MQGFTSYFQLDPIISIYIVHISIDCVKNPAVATEPGKYTEKIA